MAEWSSVSADGDGKMSDAVDPTNPDTESVDALLAELLGPEFGSGGTEVGDQAEDELPRPADSEIDGEVDSRTDREFAGETDEIGSEDPTVAFPDVMPSLDDVVATINGTTESDTPEVPAGQIESELAVSKPVPVAATPPPTVSATAVTAASAPRDSARPSRVGILSRGPSAHQRPTRSPHDPAGEGDRSSSPSPRFWACTCYSSPPGESTRRHTSQR